SISALMDAKRKPSLKLPNRPLFMSSTGSRGAPIWPIVDRPVPASSVLGENPSATQPFPTRPAPIDIQGLREDDLIDLTPELRKEALQIVANYEYGPLYTPPSY